MIIYSFLQFPFNKTTCMRRRISKHHHQECSNNGCTRPDLAYIFEDSDILNLHRENII